MYEAGRDSSSPEDESSSRRSEASMRKSSASASSMVDVTSSSRVVR